MKPMMLLCLALESAPAVGQTVYKCPSPDGTIAFSQTPCAGEAVTVRPIKPSGEGLRESEKAYLEQSEKARQQAQADARPARSGEVEKECMDMKRRLGEMKERESRGIHTWSKHGYEESHWREKEYQELCGP